MFLCFFFPVFLCVFLCVISQLNLIQARRSLFEMKWFRVITCVKTHHVKMQYIDVFLRSYFYGVFIYQFDIGSLGHGSGVDWYRFVDVARVMI